MYQVEWIVENRVILFRGIGDQTIETVEDAVNRLYKLANQGIEPVHLITDTQYTGSFPKNINALKQVIARPKNIGIVMITGGDSLYKFISLTLTKITGGESPVFRNTLEDALTYLAFLDPTLPHPIEYTDQSPVDLKV